MHRENLSELNSLPASRGLHGVSFEPQDSAAPETANSDGLLGKHGGKLAAAAAAMLGVAIFYKWREHRLAKDEPEEYARLQRLKQAVKNEERMPKTPHDQATQN